MRLNFFQKYRLSRTLGKSVVANIERAETPEQETSQKEERPVEQQGDEQNSIVGDITLALMKNGEIRTLCRFLPTDDGSKAYGEFLFCLHSGKLQYSSISTLTDVANQNVSMRPLVNNILEKWQDLVTQEDDRPLILPHEALRMGHNPEEE